MLEVYRELCDGQADGQFPAYHSISGSDNEILNNDTESRLDESIDLDNAIGKTSCRKEPEHAAKTIHQSDTLLFLYTSGTTGSQPLN